MSNKKSDEHKPLTKNVAAMMSAAIAVSSVVSLIPAPVASADELAAIADVNNAATAAEMQTALARPDLALNLTSYGTLSAQGQAIVAQSMIDSRPGGGYATQQDIQEQLNTYVSDRQNIELLANAIAAVNNAATASEMRTALESTALGLILTTYNNLSTPDGKLNAAALMLQHRTNQGGSFTSQTDIQNWLNDAVQEALDAEALATAVAGVNQAADANALATALGDPYLGLILTSYQNLNATDRLAVAQQMYDEKQSNGAFADKNAIQTKLNELVTLKAMEAAYAAAVAVVNGAVDAAEMKSALEAAGLGLDLVEYYKLNAAHRLAAAQAMLNQRTADGSFANQPAIQAALSVHVAAEQISQAVDVVNAAADRGSIKSALTAVVLGLSLDTYNGLLLNDKNTVADAVLAARPGGGFADKAAVQAALDAALAANAPLAAVNLAGDTAAMRAALEAALLGLTPGVYSTWLTADRNAVADAVQSARSGDGYIDQAAVQTAFDTAVTNRTPVATVNLSADAAAMLTALAGINLLPPAAWDNVDKLAVAQEVLDARPSDGYVSGPAAELVFDAAELNRAPLASVNLAADAAAMQLALEDADLALPANALYTSYTKSADRTAVASSVLQHRTSNGAFATKAAIVTVFDSAVDARASVAAVNLAVDEAAMQAALEDNDLALNLGTHWSGWKSADKAAVSAHVLANVPTIGFADQAAVQAAFNTAVSDVMPLASVNAATNATEMDAALTDAALNLTLGALYATYGTQIAAIVADNRPLDGFENKAAVQAALDLANAIQAVNIAADEASMETALEAVDLGLVQGIYENWKPADQTAAAAIVISIRGGGSWTMLANVQTAFNAAVNNREPEAAVNSAATEAELRLALEGATLNLNVSGYSGWLAVDVDAVLAGLLADQAADTTGYADKAAIQAALNAKVTARQPIAELNLATTGAAAKTAVEAITGLDRTAYDALPSDANRLLVSAYLVDERPASGYADVAAVQSALAAAIAADAPMAAVNAAASAAQMKTAIEDATLALTLDEYAGWLDVDKLAVAEYVRTNRGTGYATKAAVQTALEDGIDARKPIVAVNAAADEAAMLAALKSNTLGLVRNNFDNWSTEDQLYVAGVVLADVGTGYAALSDIQLKFNDAVTARTPLAAVNLAADEDEMDLVLNAYETELTLDLTVYGGWVAIDQAAVSAALVAARPADGYADTGALAAEFSAKMTDRQPIAALNLAASGADILTVLATEPEGLDQGVFTSWLTNDREAVAAAVHAARPGGGYPGFADWAAVQSAFDSAVTARQPIAAVNLATSALAMGTALGDMSLGLNLSPANQWKMADQLAISADVLAGIPAGAGYADQNAIQAAFDQAVLDRQPVAAVNIAATDSAALAALTDVSLGLDLTDFNLLSAADKLEAANQVRLAAPVTNGYADKASIQDALDAAIDQGTLARDANALQIGFASGDSPSEVLGHLTLPVSGVGGSVITWESSKSYVNVDSGAGALGEVTRPAYLDGDAAVTLKATLSYQGQTRTKQFVIIVVKNDITDAEAVGADASALNIGYSGSNSAASVTGDLTLPVAGDYGTTITWASADEDVVSTTGEVSRPARKAGNAIVKLTATIAKGASTQTKEFTLNVLRLDQYNDAEAVEEDAAALRLTYNGADTAAGVVNPLGLPTAGANGSVVTWTSSDTTVVAADGTVTRPAFTAGDKTVTLTATITKGGETETKLFTVTVLKQLTLNDAESAAADKAALALGFSGTDTESAVSGNLTLPTAGANGTTIAWLSSDANVISLNGTVTRPAHTAGDKAITLSATIIKGNVTETKQFIVNVLKQSALNDSESVAADKTALAIGFTGNETASAVTGNLTLPLSGASGTTIAWATSDANVIAASGVVTRPANTSSDKAVTLTATITKGNVTETKQFIVNVVKQSALNDSEAVAADKTALAIGFTGNETASAVTGNLTLPLSGASGTTIAWATSDANVIAASGVVTRPANTSSDKAVTLTATITKGNVTETKQFIVNVLKQSALNDNESVAADKTALAIGFTGNETASAVTGNLTLPLSGASGTTIAWATSDANVIAASGVVTRPANTSSDKAVTLTATITKGNVTETKQFIVNVLKQSALNDNESVAADKTALAIGFTGNETASAVTGNLTLPLSGASGTTIAWATSDANVIAAIGTVTRPANASGDKAVTLTATITKGNVTETKSFTVTVLKRVKTSQPAAANILVVNREQNQSDTIEVGGLQAGDVVRVYSALNVLLGTETVGAQATSATVTVAQLGTGGGTVLVSVTRAGLEESDKATVAYAAEGAKPFVISDGSLTTTNGVLAKVTVSPTAGMTHSGNEVVIFQLMRGNEPVSIVVLEKDVASAEELKAHFNVSGANYSVKVFVADAYSGSFTEVGNALADPVVLN
ncbi:immunoglobulin-like domain-containing protein [Paenibacillus sp. SYP-B4298]|uniref:immunoglobulin-like domain-containing protein n=1 Tax=Paenibacillus sp. SYP-B4298 TaxID=2996034 RepID=UPI0022DDD9BE|nr:immunoglobulin-like domain-containing protein [Paenibacillus sp. SYP-B4298]